VAALGMLEDRAQLVGAARLAESSTANAVRSPDGETWAGADDPGLVACTATLGAGDPEVAEVVLVGTATWRGTAARVVVFATEPSSAANGTRRAYVVAPATCEVLALATY
jgi:hypothetical protein